MDAFDEQLLAFWQQLNHNNVRYIMIGGFATRFHGFNRATNDIDIWLEDTSINRKKLRKTFADLKYGDYPTIETMDFVPGWTTFYTAGIELDIITEMKGLENIGFDECLKLSSVADIDGVKIPFLHINHLIQNKKITNRPKDKVDVQELEKIRELIKKK